MPTAISTIRGVFQAMGVLLGSGAANDVWNSKDVSRLARQIGRDHVDVLVLQGDRHLHHGPMPRPRRTPERKSRRALIRYSGRCPASRAVSPWPEKSSLWQLSQWRGL